MNDHIQVSICCTAYNHEKYIRQCLDGFMMQKEIQFEILIHDDASTDNTAEIIREYENKYPCIIKPIYQKENKYSQGIHISDTYLFPNAQGKYIAFCEGDDYWTDPYKLKKQYDFMIGHQEYVMCYHANNVVDVNGKQIRNNILHHNNCELSLEECLCPEHGFPQTATLFAKKEIMVNRPEFCLHTPVGDIVHLAWSSVCGKVYYMNDIMSSYRTGVSGSWSSRLNDDVLMKHCKSMSKFFLELDSYTHFTYHKYIEKKLEGYQLQIDIYQRRCMNVLKNKCFYGLSNKQKIRALMQIVCPSLLQRVRSIKNILTRKNLSYIK